MRSFFSHSHPWKWAKIYHWWFPITALEHQRKRIFRHILCRVSAAFRQSHLQQRQFLILSVHPGGCEYINIYCFIYPHVRTCIQNIQCISGMLKCTLSHMLTPLKLGYILVNNVTLLWHNGIIMVQHFFFNFCSTYLNDISYSQQHFFVVLFCFVFRATPEAYGSFQAR